MLKWKPEIPNIAQAVMQHPYSDISGSVNSNPVEYNPAIIITGRFRSGSTLLWNLFRHVEGCTSYYEPFNERRWFDPKCRGDRIDATHRNAEEYWREYERLAELKHYYQEEWIERALFMDSETWAPKMKRFVEVLIESSPERSVLQFNRIDFRLAWFRRNFPNAYIIHLYRHPRDQWCSTLMDIHCFGKNDTMTAFAEHDRFYLLAWAKDLKHHFPFLDQDCVTHPYQLFYYLWRLSYLFGVCYANQSICFEKLVQNPESTLRDLFARAQVSQTDFQVLNQLFHRPAFGKWRAYADEDWFAHQERICDRVLTQFLAASREVQ